MPSCTPIDLDSLALSIDRQTDVVARAASSARYSEIVRLQMLRDMRDILAQAYVYRTESADLYRRLHEEAS